MHSEFEEDDFWTPRTEEDRNRIRQQMNRLLETSHFKNSRRYPALFRFMVEETLEGRGEFLKERLLGISVFGRQPDYDTAADPTVRVSVAEIRKRIAQYYHEEAHDPELRIDILPGRYQPAFRLRKGMGAEFSRATEEKEPESSANSTRRQSTASAPEAYTRSAQSLTKRITLAWLILLGFAIIAASWLWLKPSVISDLWGPLLNTKGPVILCIAGGPGAHDADTMRALLHSSTPPETAPNGDTTSTNGSPTFLNHMVLDENVVFADSLAMARILDLLARKKREYQIRLSGNATLDDLRLGPGVLIGGLDNSWTLRTVSRLRYRFDADNVYRCWISDTKNPQSRAWSLDLKKQYTAVSQDYAIVARVHNEQTGQIEVLAAGLGMSGTMAASELLVNPELVKELRRRIGSGFKTRDFEVVVRTDVVNGLAGPPVILAVEVW